MNDQAIERLAGHFASCSMRSLAPVLAELVAESPAACARLLDVCGAQWASDRDTDDARIRALEAEIRELRRDVAEEMETEGGAS